MFKNNNRNFSQLFNGVPNDKQLWTYGIIPYEIDYKLRDINHLLEKAFKHINEKTFIQFLPRREDRNYVYITEGEGSHCQSMVGMVGGKQELILGYGCKNIGTILHELMHTIGFFHEHSRSDRDMFLDIHLENVELGMEKNFLKLHKKENRLLEPFDYKSITIYGEYSFSGNGFPTMVPLNGEKITEPYMKSSLSHLDSRFVDKLYKYEC